MSDWNYKKIQCPYFRKKWGRNLTCEGPLKGTTVSINFSETGTQLEYMQDFCNELCWQGCPIAQAAAEKYENEG